MVSCWWLYEHESFRVGHSGAADAEICIAVKSYCKRFYVALRNYNYNEFSHERCKSSGWSSLSRIIFYATLCCPFLVHGRPFPRAVSQPLHQCSLGETRLRKGGASHCSWKQWIHFFFPSFCFFYTKLF